MSWSLLIRGGTVIDGSGAPRAGARRRGGGRPHRRHRARADGAGGSRDRRERTRGRPGLHRRPLPFGPLLHGLPVVGVEDPPGLHHRGRRACARSPRRPSRPAARNRCGAGRAASARASTSRWEGFGQYLDALRVRAAVDQRRPLRGPRGAAARRRSGPTTAPVAPDDLRAMQRLLDEAIDAGAFGYSTGLVYAPSAYAGTEELVALARGMARRGGSTSRTCGARARWWRTSIREAIRIGEEGGVGVQIAHVKASGRENWGKMDARAPPDRRRAGARRRRDRRRVSLSRGQHQDGQPAARRGCTTAASPSCSSASATARRARAHRRGMRGRRRALGHRLAGRAWASTRS